MGIKDRIVEYMKNESYNPMSRENLKTEFGFKTKSETNAFYGVLKDMEKEGTIIRDNEERYSLTEDSGLIIGELQGHERGFGFLIPENKELKDIFISPDNMLNAFNGDKVLGRITKESGTDRSSEGEIIRIIERKHTKIVGTFQHSKSFGFLVPDDKRINYDVFIPKAHINRAKTNQKVVAEITKWPTKGRNPEGRIVDILGFTGEQGTDILSIIKQMDLPYEFPKEVISEAENINQEVTDEDIKDRVDLRELATFTIDGADAKDLDDAITIEKLENGNYNLGVHIADVSHYVRERSPMDKEAYERGNSVYLIDRVVPMLPEELSNGICSLHPDVDRLAISVFMEIDKNGNVKYHKIQETVIRSDRRLVYDHVSNLLEGKGSHESLEGIEDELFLLKELSEILYKKRSRRGSIDFDFPETKIVLDDKGKPEYIGEEERRVSNKIIEECMLVCNETIAEDMHWAEIPFIYRVHEEPSLDRINEFNKFIHNFGYMLKANQEVHPKELQKITEEIKGKKEETLISMLMLRSLKKARYSEIQEMHFGLASQHYCHFTAPIRRYADLEIHRIIKLYINGKLGSNRQDKLEEFLPKVADHTSKTERTAELAEREVHDLKKAEYMAERVGNEYKGMISSLTNFGIFVQLDNTIEGLIRYGDMRDDFYDFDEENYQVRGKHSGKIYNLGDIVKIEVTGADISRRTIDFKLIKEDKDKLEEE